MLPGLSVHCMVLNPPIDRLAALVEYLRPVANEYVIVDTGSADVTKDIMRSWPQVRLIEEPFEDFSTTRNKGLAQHQYEWTLGLDPDELPSIMMVQHVRWVLSEGADQFPLALGFLYFTKNYWGGVLGPEMDYHWHTRLWKTGSGRLYRPVHELVALDGRPESETRGTPTLPRAPREACLIHSKSVDEIARADELYARLGEISR